MATWITHFRIAERLKDLGLPVCKEEFVVGNIGPDCGLYREGADRTDHNVLFRKYISE